MVLLYLSYAREMMSMRVKSGLALVAMGVGGTILYQNIRNGNVKRMVSKMKRSKTKAAADLENMI